MSLRRNDDRAGDETTTPVATLLQRIELRSGDDLPGFAAVVEDQLGTPVDLTGSICWIIVCDEHNVEAAINTQCSILNAPAGVVQFDWDTAITAMLGPGYYELFIVAEWADGRRVTAPSDRSLFLIIRPNVPA